MFIVTVNHFIVDNRKLVSCGSDGFLKIFDINTGSEVFAKNSNNQLKWVVSVATVCCTIYICVSYLTFSVCLSTYVIFIQYHFKSESEMLSTATCICLKNELFAWSICHTYIKAFFISTVTEMQVFSLVWYQRKESAWALVNVPVIKLQ